MNRYGVLTNVDVQGTGRIGGHAVILMHCNPSSLTFINSWGDQWGNGGFFSIAGAKVLSNKNFPMQFFDV